MMEEKQRSKFQPQTNIKTVSVDFKKKKNSLSQRPENRGIQVRIKDSTNTFWENDINYPTEKTISM